MRIGGMKFSASKFTQGVLGAAAIMCFAVGQASASGGAGQGTNSATTPAAASAAAGATTGQFSSTGAGAVGTTEASRGGAQYASLGAKSTSMKYFNLREQGRAAGSRELKFNVWLNGAYSWIDKDDQGGDFDGGVASLVGGIDYKVTKRAVVGIGLGYENVDIDVNFNNGKLEADGLSVAGYGAVSFKPKFAGSPEVVLTGSGGYTFVDYDTSRNNGATTGSFDAGRWFLAGNVTANYLVNKGMLRLSPKMGLLYVQESQDAYTESTGAPVSEQLIALGRFNIGMEAGYRIKVKSIKFIEPYAKVLWEWDWEHEDGVALGNGNFTSDDDNGFVAGGGINLVVNDRLSARIEGTANAIARENLDIYTLQGQIRYRF